MSQERHIYHSYGFRVSGPRHCYQGIKSLFTFFRAYTVIWVPIRVVERFGSKHPIHFTSTRCILYVISAFLPLAPFSTTA